MNLQNRNRPEKLMVTKEEKLGAGIDIGTTIFKIDNQGPT